MWHVPERFREATIKKAHETLGHMAATKTMKWILEDFVWKGMRKDVRSYVRRCAICEAYHRRPVRVEMQEIEIPATPMMLVGLDIIGPFAPDEFGRKFLLTAIDYLSGWAEPFSMRDQSARELI